MVLRISRHIAISALFAGHFWMTPLCARANDDDLQSNPKAKAVSEANRAFPTPEMQPPSLNQDRFQFTDVGAKIPNYTPGARWGTQGELQTLMQNPVPAETSIGAYSVPKGFELSLWAKESNENWPGIKAANDKLAGLQGKPLAMNWDERGRLWICESIDYPNELQPVGQGRDRIKICEDTDGDGHADKFTIFAEHLSIPSTLVCYRGGVLVQDGQVTVYLKDIDGDDKADFRQELITGWALGDTHGGVSNFQYGVDNWIWAMQGYNNSEPVINGVKQMRFRQGFWRFKVVRGKADETAPAFAIDAKTYRWDSSKQSSNFQDHTLRVEALEFVRATNNNTWGLGFSEEGYVFGSTANGCPSVHMPIPNRYYDQVAGWSPKALERISDSHKFQPADDAIRQVDWHGGYTAGCGSALYTARNYPKDWWNRVSMVCEPTGHLVGAFVLDKSGAGYKSRNTFNAVASIDDWAAPIMAEVGPDGNVWVLDWYNYIIQHNPTPNGFKTGKGAAYESDLRDKRYSRIYRLLYNASSSATTEKTQLNSKSTTKELIASLGNSNFFWRRTAQRLLVERGVNDPESLNALVASVESSDMDSIGLSPKSMHAIWTLAGLAESGNAQAKTALATACEKGMKHISSPVRSAAIQHATKEQVLSASQSELIKDPDPRVQLSLLLRMADSLDGASVPTNVLASLIQSNAAVQNDDILLDAWTAASSKNAVGTLLSLSKLGGGEKWSKEVAARISILAEHLARSKPDSKAIETLLTMDPASPFTGTVYRGMAKGWPKDHSIALASASQQLVKQQLLSDTVSLDNRAALLAISDKWGVGELDTIVKDIQSKLFEVALNNAGTTEKRVEAWDQAVRLAPSSETIAQAAERLFTPQLSLELGGKALDSLQAARVPGLSKRLLALRSKLGPKLAGSVLTLLLARTESTMDLLDAIDEGRIQFSELQLDQRQALLNHPDKKIADRASESMKTLGAKVTTNRQGLVDEWMPVTKMAGDVENGVAMYKKHCALCHIHGELGTPIGPNLTGMAVHPKEEILVNVLDPSRSVEQNFRTYQILTVDDAIITGMLAGESTNSLRLITTQGKEVQVLREEIEQMNASVKSLMPEGFESLMTKQEMADLLAFLAKREKFTPVSLTSGATISSAQGIINSKDNPNERFQLARYGKIEFEGIPFEVQDPQEGRVPNMIMLQGTQGNVARALPKSTMITCNGKVDAIHLLGGIAVFGGGPPNQDQTTSLIVRCTFADGTTEDTPLLKGKHIAPFDRKVDVPESKYAMDANGRQVRYLKIPVNNTKELKGIEFLKGDDGTAPIVLAVTVESASAHP